MSSFSRISGSPSVSGRIHSFESFGATDGPGLRCVVFFQGCPLRCLFCHNPDSRPPAAGTETDSEALMKRIRSIRSFLRTGGVTLSGGEPTMQKDFCLDLLRRCRAEGFHTALDTAAPYPPEETKDILSAADLILLDIKALRPDLCSRISGRDGQTALDTLDFCERTGKDVWIRHVLTPGLTLESGLLRELASYLKKYRCVRKVELLPFHKMGEMKWRALGWNYSLYDVAEPSLEEVAEAEKIFR